MKIVISGSEKKVKQLVKELAPRCKYDKLTIEVESEPVKPDHSELLKKSVSELTKNWDKLTPDELNYLMVNDQRNGIIKMFA